MQRCPKCGRTYENDAQKFCTHDGGRLEHYVPPPSNQGATAYDLNQTIRTNPYDPEATAPQMPDLNRTVASLPTSEIRSKDTGPALPPPSAPTYQPPPSPPPTPAQGPTVMLDQQEQSAPPPPPQQQHYYQAPPQPPQPPVRPPQTPQPPQMSQPQYAPQPPMQQPQHQYAPQASARPRTKSSRAPLIIGIVVILLLGGAAAWYFLIYKKNNTATNANSNAANTNVSANVNANTSVNANANTSANTNANTSVPEPPPPPNSTKFVNARANLDGKLAEKYSDFSFYYPNTWERDPKTGVPGANNFIRVERKLPPDFTQENFTVSWYDSKGTLETDKAEVFPKLVESTKSKLSKTYPEFKVVSEDDTTINGIKGHEFRFQSVSKGTEKGDITIWGRVIFLPPGREDETNGIQLLMLTTSLAPEIKSADDVGVRGELPMILNSFKMGNH